MSSPTRHPNNDLYNQLQRSIKKFSVTAERFSHLYKRQALPIANRINISFLTMKASVKFLSVRNELLRGFYEDENIELPSTTGGAASLVLMSRLFLILLIILLPLLLSFPFFLRPFFSTSPPQIFSAPSSPLNPSHPQLFHFCHFYFVLLFWRLGQEVQP